MQRRSSKMLLMLLTLSVFFSTVAAAPAETKSLVLIEVRYVQGAGIILLFDSTGLTKKDLQGGTAKVHSRIYEMTCNFKDESSVVRCLIPASLSRYAGETFRANVAGFLFWPTLPAAKSGPLVCSANESVWYTIFIYQDGVLVDWGEIPAQDYEWLLAYIAAHPAEFEGITIKIVDRYCVPQIIIEPPA